MTPRVNVVANGESRIRQLEDEVRALRNQLLEAERQRQLNKGVPVPKPADLLSGGKQTSTEEADVLEAQLQLENDTLRQDKEALARYKPQISPHRRHSDLIAFCNVVVSACR